MALGMQKKKKKKMMLVAWQFPCRGHRSFFRQLQVIGSVPVPLVETCLLCALMMLAMLGMQL